MFFNVNWAILFTRQANGIIYFDGFKGGDIMSAISIEFAERLKREKVFSSEKADAFARALNDELSHQLATKPDLIQLENGMDNRMVQMENRLIKWMIGLVLAAIAINLTVTGFLMTHLISIVSQLTVVG